MDIITKLILTLSSVVLWLVAVLIIKLVVNYNFKKSKNSNAKKVGNIYSNVLIAFSAYVLGAIAIAIWLSPWILLAYAFLIVIFLFTNKRLLDYQYTKAIVLENQYDNDEIIKIGDFIGKVISITPLSTVLVNLDGARKVIANSTIKEVINLSRNYTVIRIILPVSNSNNIEDVIKLLNDKLPEVIDSYPQIIEGPNVSGIEEIEEDYVKLGIYAKVVYDQHLEVEKAIRLYIKRIFKEKGIL